MFLSLSDSTQYYKTSYVVQKGEGSMNIRFLLIASIIVLISSAGNAAEPIDDVQFAQAAIKSPQTVAQNLLNMKGLSLADYQAERGELINALLPAESHIMPLPSDMALAEHLAAEDRFFQDLVAQRTATHLAHHAATVLRRVLDGRVPPKKRRKIDKVTLPEYGGRVVQVAGKLGVVFARGFTDDIGKVSAEARKGLTAQLYQYVKWWNHVMTSFNKKYDPYLQKHLVKIIPLLPNDSELVGLKKRPQLKMFLVVARLALVSSQFTHDFSTLIQAAPLERSGQEAFDIAALYDALRTKNDRAVSVTCAHMIRDFLLYNSVRGTHYALLLSRFELGQNIAEALTIFQERDIAKLMMLAQSPGAQRVGGVLPSLRAPTMPSLRTGGRHALSAIAVPPQNNFVKAVTRVAHDPVALRQVLTFAVQQSGSSPAHGMPGVARGKVVTKADLAQDLLAKVLAELPPVNEHQTVMPKFKKVGTMNWRRLFLDDEVTKAYNTVGVPLYEQVVSLLEELLRRLPEGDYAPGENARRVVNIKQMTLELLPSVLQSAVHDTPGITPEKRQLLLLVSSAAELLVELKRHVAAAAVFHGVQATAGR